MQMISGPGQVFQDGIFTTVPAYDAGMYSGGAFAFEDGVLGDAAMFAGPGKSFRDGVFSTADPVASFAQYNQQAFQDGVLGSEMMPSIADASTKLQSALPSPVAQMSPTTKALAFAGAGLLALGLGYIVYRAVK